MRIANVLTLSLLALGTAVAAAQQPAMSSGTGSEIRLRVVVTPGDKGKPVAGLAENDFKILDNGAPQPIRTFRTVSGNADPVEVLLVIDAVNTGFDHIAYERQQIDKFLRANDGRLSQPTALAIFTDTGTKIEPGFSTDGNALSDMLAKQVVGLRDLRRSAGFYGAAERLDLSLKTMGQLVSRAGAEPGRKFILWISPGWPLLSGPDVQLSSKDQQRLFEQVVAFSTALRKANTTVYAVDPLGAGEGPGRTFYFEEFTKGVTKPSQALPGDLGLQVLAVQSGGRFLGSNNDLSELLRQCFADASISYELTYDAPPSEHPNQYHRVEVRVAEPHLTARTREGYYSEP